MILVHRTGIGNTLPNDVLLWEAMGGFRFIGLISSYIGVDLTNGVTATSDLTNGVTATAELTNGATATALLEMLEKARKRQR